MGERKESKRVALKRPVLEELDSQKLKKVVSPMTLR